MTTCIVCDDTRFRDYLKILRRCVRCGHVVARGDESTADFKALYDAVYFQGGEYYDYPGDRSCAEMNFRARLKSVRQFCPQGQLLEIGSAYGFFLNLARTYFSAVGYELCADAVQYAHKQFDLDVRCSDFLQDELPEGAYDAIVMWDVIEHLPDPQDFVAKAHRLLKKGGILALTTGDIESFLAARQGAQWRLIHPPTHIHYFSQKTMLQLLHRHGFQIARVDYPGYWRTIRQIFYSLLILRPAPRESLFAKINSSPFAKTPVYLNTLDIMQVIARK